MSTTRDQISKRIDAAGPGRVWVPQDFALLANREVIDKTLQRMVSRGELRRIGRGLYDRPAINTLTKRPATPDYRAVVDAIARRDQTRLLIDGMTAANDLGLSDAIPARVTIYSDTRRRSVRLDKLVIEFKLAAPSRLYWAGRPAMRVVQALHWLNDMLPRDGDSIRTRLANRLNNPDHGAAIRQDLADGFNVLPIWMQSFLRTVPGFDPVAQAAPNETSPTHPAQRRRKPAAHRRFHP